MAGARLVTRLATTRSRDSIASGERCVGVSRCKAEARTREQREIDIKMKSDQGDGRRGTRDRDSMRIGLTLINILLKLDTKSLAVIKSRIEQVRERWRQLDVRLIGFNAHA